MTTPRIEVFMDWLGGPQILGRLRRIPSRHAELISFEYAQEWLDHPERFEIDPALPLTKGEFYPDVGMIHGALLDSAPDRWGKDLMRRRERRLAETEGRTPRALQELDLLLGVADISRLGALRFREEGTEPFVASTRSGVPGLVELGRLMAASDRIQQDEFDDEDLQLIFAPGSSLGGARPKASVIDNNGQLSIAKFPKNDDEYDLERWESIALELANRAGIDTAAFNLVTVGNRHVLLSRRFDRQQTHRLPFISAMALTGHRDGDRDCSYLELAEMISARGAHPVRDRQELFRRIAFSILISNVDDHLRNHGFIREGQGWSLAPAYDLNPVPPHLKPPILSTAIDLDDRTADIGLLLSTAEEYGLQERRARSIIREVAEATVDWQEVAKRSGARNAEITLMTGAFEHDRLDRALSL
ncbi:type II toxin-antitoxin system HipA family toxin [Aidingimonas lacisalsi]|uniref:type II toxin-antitoxin system HipA family toxin n=1 Tax=Aidingimonas lacisalsi TaxID=2604086 RepID=UPI0011D2164D|nr:type II toxin-antitoxin system HipA family toxin [Aidingimonas lacisalsi]